MNTRWVILITVGISLLMLWGLSRLTYNYDVQSFFSPADPDWQFFQQVQDRFPGSGNFVSVGIEQEGSFFRGNAFLRLDSLCVTLDTIAGVEEVISPTNLKNLVFSWFGKPRHSFFSSEKTKTPASIRQAISPSNFRAAFLSWWAPAEPSFFHPQEPDRYKQDSALFWAYQDIRPRFLSDDASACTFFLRISDSLNTVERATLVGSIHRSIQAWGFSDYYLYGDLIAKDSNVEALQSEMLRLSVIAGALILVVLYCSFRSVRGIVLPLIVVALTVLWTLGLMGLTGGEINLMTVLIPTIVSIVALSDSIHILSGLREHLPRAGIREAMRLTLSRIRAVIFLTSVTTAFGFLTLASSNVGPFVAFGVFTAIGVVIAYVLSIVLLPLLAITFGVKVSASKGRWSLSSWMAGPMLDSLVRWKFGILGLAVILLMLSGAGIARVKVNAGLYEDLSSGDAFSRTLSFFERHFGGIRSVDLWIQRGPEAEHLLDDSVLGEVEQLHDYMSQEYGVQAISDLSVLVKRMSRSLSAGDPDAWGIPSDSNQMQIIRTLFSREHQSLQLGEFLSEDLSSGRLTGRMPDPGSWEMAQKNQQLQEFIRDSIDANLLEVRLTGVPYLLDQSNARISQKLFWGLLLAIGLVSVIMGLMYRSGRMLLVAILPNLLPLMMILGLIGWLDIGLKMSTAITFTIAFGIAVDDTIHMMSMLRKAFSEGKSTHEAIRNTFSTTGRAIVVTSVILICGFGILLFSSFYSSFLTGMLISLALVFALFSDLLLLPVLLLLVRK